MERPGHFLRTVLCTYVVEIQAKSVARLADQVLAENGRVEVEIIDPRD